MYLLDADVFIQAKNGHYGLDFAPGFWEWLSLSHGAGRLASVESIRLELSATQDDISAWAKAHQPLFLLPDSKTQPSLKQLATWVMDPSHHYRRSARDAFLKCGDYQLVAHAHAHGDVVVTHEVARPEAKKKIKIPDACHALGVQCIDPFKMLRDEQVRLVLGNSAPNLWL